MEYWRRFSVWQARSYEEEEGELKNQEDLLYEREEEKKSRKQSDVCLVRIIGVPRFCSYRRGDMNRASLFCR
jgi:hypothetical protein